MSRPARHTNATVRPITDDERSTTMNEPRSPQRAGAPSQPYDEQPTAEERTRGAGQDGSLVTEYGLLAVVAATIAGVLIQWATGGAVINLFNALVDRARELVGA